VDCAHNGGQLSTATFTNVTVTPLGGGPLPGPWANGDVGTPSMALTCVLTGDIRPKVHR
jgi:hypothetical protein